MTAEYTRTTALKSPQVGMRAFKRLNESINDNESFKRLRN